MKGSGVKETLTLTLHTFNKTPDFKFYPLPNISQRHRNAVGYCTDGVSDFILRFKGKAYSAKPGIVVGRSIISISSKSIYSTL